MSIRDTLKMRGDYDGLIVRTRMKKYFDSERRFITGKLIISMHFDLPYFQRTQVWTSKKNWVWLDMQCDKRAFRILPKEEALIWKLEHNM